jgi:hypothetical protein
MKKKKKIGQKLANLYLYIVFMHTEFVNAYDINGKVVSPDHQCCFKIVLVTGQRFTPLNTCLS